MRKHLIGLVIVIAAAVATISCGGSSSTSQTGSVPPGSGQLALMGTDAPVCGVASFDVTITSATLSPQGGGVPVSVFDSSNPVTVDFASLMGFNTLLNMGSVRAEHPDVSGTVPLLSKVVVNISPETEFKIATFGADLSAFLFNASAIARGQHVVVHGPFTAGTPSTATANMIVLRPQPVLGNALASPNPVIGSDGKSGGYYLEPCNPLFQNQTVNVVTFSGTLFNGLTDLNGLDNTSVYLNRGFLLYKTSSGSLNGLSWTAPPPAYVFPSYLVRKLNVP